MHIGIAAPLATADIIELLGDHEPKLPMGYPGAPLIGTLIRSLINRGHRVSAFTTDQSLNVQNGNIVAIGQNLDVYYIPQRPSAFYWRAGVRGRAWDLFQYERTGLVNAIRQAQPDIVHAHWTYEFAWAAVDSGLPYLVTAHDSPKDILWQSVSFYRAIRYLMAQIVFKRATAFTAVSPFIKNAIQTYVKCDIDIIGNPLKINVEYSSRNYIYYKNSSRPSIAVVINSWQRLKNPECTFRAFAILRKQIPGASLHAFGADFEPGGKAEAWCRANKVLEGCVFRGRLPFTQLQEALASADLLLHTSRLESCPMGILEAMSLGLPVVGGRQSGGVPWAIGDAGLVTDIENPHLVAEAMYKLLTNSALYQRCSEVALLRSRQEFGAEEIVTRFVNLYQKILASRSTQC